MGRNRVDKDALNLMGAAAIGLALLLGLWPQQPKLEGQTVKCGSPFAPKEPPQVKEVGFDGKERWVDTNSLVQKYCSDEMSGRRTVAIISGVAGVLLFVGAASTDDKKKSGTDDKPNENA